MKLLSLLPSQPSLIVSAVLAFVCGSAAAQDVPIILPGAPGDAGRQLSADEAIDIADNSYSPDDVQFMQDMIPHHNQAVQMSALVGDRTNLPELRDIAGRIDSSQADEIEFMEQWLNERGETVPEATAHSAMHTSHDMAGMASPEDMAELARLEGTELRPQVPDPDDRASRGRGENGRGTARSTRLRLRPGAVPVRD